MFKENLAADGLRRVLGRFATGVTVLSRDNGNERHGMTANAFMSLSLDPPLVGVAIRHESRFLQGLELGEQFGISFLCAEQQHVAQFYASRGRSHLGDYLETKEGVPVVEGASEALIVSLQQRHLTGDHEMLVLQIEHIYSQRDARPPLLFHASSFRFLPDLAA